METDVRLIPPVKQAVLTGGTDEEITFSIPADVRYFKYFLCSLTMPTDVVGALDYLAMIGFNSTQELKTFKLKNGYYPPGYTGNVSYIGMIDMEIPVGQANEYSVFLLGLASSSSDVVYVVDSAYLAVK